MAAKKSIVLLSGLWLGLAGAGHAQPASRVAAAKVGDTAGDPTGGATAATPEILAYADEMPAFPGGDAAFRQYLAQRINYPAEANQRNLSGTVYVRFVVDADGRIRDAEVAKGCGHGFDEEALRLVRLMPWWVPGHVAGKPVWVARTLPIVFRLSR